MLMESGAKTLWTLYTSILRAEMDFLDRVSVANSMTFVGPTLLMSLLLFGVCVRGT